MIKRFIFLILLCILAGFIIDKGARADDIVCSDKQTYKACSVQVGFYKNGNRVILTVHEHAPLLKLLYTAKKNDVIHLYFIGNGGYVNTTMALMNAIKDTNATTIAHIIGPVYSAHALIPLAADTVIASDTALIMFHDGHYNLYGGTRSIHLLCKDRMYEEPYKKCVEEFKRYAEFSLKFFSLFVRKVLTKQEFEDFKNGHDVYIFGKQLNERLRK